jgi:biotin synthase-related radical SAM superfamily protein
MFKLEPWLEITTVSKCAIDCSFCPQNIFQERYRGCNTLSFCDFKKALSTVPKNVTLHFSGLQNLS